MKRLAITMAVSAIFSTVVQAAPVFEITNSITSGEGCSENTVSTSVVNNFVRFGFGGYSANSANSSRLFDSASCNIALEVKIPDGIRIALAELEYRGSVYVPEGGKATFSLDYWFAGGKVLEKPHRSTWEPQPNAVAIEEDFLLIEKIETKKWSKCGGMEVFRINSHARAHAGDNEDTYIQLDTTDPVLGFVSANFETEEC